MTRTPRVMTAALLAAAMALTSLGDGLAAEDALPAVVRAATSVQVVFDLLEVENGEKLLHGG